MCLLIFKYSEEKFTLPQIGIYNSYSITIIDSETSDVLRYIPDVFTDFEKACEFVSLCNAHQPELIHIDELIESFYNK